MLTQKLHREVIVSLVPRIKILVERIVQQTPTLSDSDRVSLRRSILTHLLADALLGASKEEIASVADLVGVLVSAGNVQKQESKTETFQEK